MTPSMAKFMADVEWEAAQHRHTETVQRTLDKAARLVETEIDTLDQAGFLVPGIRAALRNISKQIRALKVEADYKEEKMDVYDTYIQQRGAVEAAQILADECRKKDAEITKLLQDKEDSAPPPDNEGPWKGTKGV